jgi:hypothetical protein
MLCPCEEFKEKFKTGDKEFRSHKELDNYVNELLKIEPSFCELYPEEWNLLKSFDRGFWLLDYERLTTLNKMEILDEQEENEKHCCPFQAPQVTGSFTCPEIEKK